MKTANWHLWIFVLLFFSSCIGDDIIEDEVEPELRVMNQVESIEVGTEYQFEVRYFNNVGQAENAVVEWSSSDDNIISISSDGLAMAIATGSVVLTASVNDEAGLTETSFNVEAGAATVTNEVTTRSGKIITTSSYILQGDFTLEATQTGVNLSIAENYETTSALPGLYIYLSNNPNSTSGALEIGAVEVFSGAHTYEINDISVNDFDHIIYFCKPFNVKVGEGNIEE